MRIELYLCDNCKKQLSKGGVGKSHISIDFSKYSGWVEPNNAKEDTFQHCFNGKNWHHTTTAGGIKQFCNGTCLGEYFDKLNKNETANRKVKKVH